jgi:hypothetical protein
METKRHMDNRRMSLFVAHHLSLVENARVKNKCVHFKWKNAPKNNRALRDGGGRRGRDLGREKEERFRKERESDVYTIRKGVSAS